MADEYYLIKGSTLTAIAESLRNFLEDRTYMPLEMPSSIGAVYDTGYTEGYADGASSELDALYDFDIYGTAEGVEFFVWNSHPTYPLEIEVEIYNNSEGGGLITINTTVPPGGEYYWTSAGDDNILIDSSSNFVNNWEINILGVRWIT